MRGRGFYWNNFNLGHFNDGSTRANPFSIPYSELPLPLDPNQSGPNAFSCAGRSGTRGRVRLVVRRALVIAQLAFSIVLVVGAALLLRTLIELNRIDLGFVPDNLLTAQLQLPFSDYPDNDDAIQFYRQLTERLEAAPGVRAAGGRGKLR